VITNLTVNSFTIALLNYRQNN